jgi:hypothetical protein
VVAVSLKKCERVAARIPSAPLQGGDVIGQHAVEPTDAIAAADFDQTPIG